MSMQKHILVSNKNDNLQFWFYPPISTFNKQCLPLQKGKITITGNCSLTVRLTCFKQLLDIMVEDFSLLIALFCISSNSLLLFAWLCSSHWNHNQTRFARIKNNVAGIIILFNLSLRCQNGKKGKKIVIYIWYDLEYFFETHPHLNRQLARDVLL